MGNECDGRISSGQQRAGYLFLLIVLFYSQYTDTSLYNQLLYYDRLFNVDHAKKCKITVEPTSLPFCARVRKAVDKVLESNAYSEVNLSKLFNTCFS